MIIDSARRGGLKAEAAMRSMAPPSLSTRRFRARWMIVMVIILGGATACFTVRSPIYVFGTGIVVPGADGSGVAVRLVVFLPAQDDMRIEVGQQIAVRTGTGTMMRRVIAVEPDVLSPDDAVTRFRLGAAAAGVVTQPARVVLAEFGTAPPGARPRDYLGSLFQVSVVVGERRVLPSMIQRMFAPRSVPS